MSATIVPDKREVSRRNLHLTVCFAGSRRGLVSERVSSRMIDRFSRLGYRFVVGGGGSGIEACFRGTLETIAASKTTVFCPSPGRVRSARASGFRAVYESSSDLSISATIHQRTASMVSKSSILVLFPDDSVTHTWDTSSLLAFNVAVQQHKTVFVATTVPPLATRQLYVIPASLFGATSGYWIIPRGAAVSVEVSDVS